MTKEIETLLEYIKDSNNIVFFGGVAGYISGFNGRHLVVINKETVPILYMDVSLGIQSSLGDVFTEIDRALFG